MALTNMLPGVRPTRWVVLVQSVGLVMVLVRYGDGPYMVWYGVGPYGMVFELKKMLDSLGLTCCMVLDQHDRWCGKKMLDGGIATYGMTCGIVLDMLHGFGPRCYYTRGDPNVV